uniref:Protein phosphatase 4 core regulatory subunit R2 n=3 Tax=Helianthus annuus TaxID=4232 RepID=A0A251RMQ9_HELAN
MVNAHLRDIFRQTNIITSNPSSSCLSISPVRSLAPSSKPKKQPTDLSFAGKVRFNQPAGVYIMETQATETTESSPVLLVTSTETTETLDQSTPPVVVVDQTQTTETLEPSPPVVANMPPAEVSPPQVTNTQVTEETALQEVTNTHEAAPSGESAPSPVTNIPAAETLDQSTLPSLEDIKTTETVEHSVVASDVTDNSHENLIASPENHQSREIRQETAEEEEEEVRSVLKVIAATGEFWYDWEKLRSMLSLHLKQVLSEYPQAKMTIEEQKISLGETHAELVKRLDDALHSFVDGPPFTLQRLSEIILDARSLYPNLSKLALALEKNLSVTSTLTMSTNPNPPSLTTPPNGSEKVNEDLNPNPNPQLLSDTVMENGALPVAMSADRDEIMTEVDADISDVMTMDVETTETTEKPSESSPMTTGDS